MTVYIQSINGYPYNTECAIAFLEFRERGADIKLFEKIEEVPLNRESMVVGSIENTHEFFKNMGWKIPQSITIPHQLSNKFWTNRNITKMSLGEALAKTEYPFFIKSYELKKFIPGVISSEDDKKWFNTAEVLDKSMPVLVSEVLNFESEYRVYVLDGKIEGISWYSGEQKYYPDYNIIQDMVRQFKDAPKFYSLDVGITTKDKGRMTFTWLVECNDGYSLGNYGLDKKIYVRGLVTRWRQLLQENPVILEHSL